MRADFSGRSLRRHFVRLIALQKDAYMDIGRELVSGRIGCWGRMPAYSACDCGRRQVSEIYLIAARVSFKIVNLRAPKSAN